MLSLLSSQIVGAVVTVKNADEQVEHLITLTSADAVLRRKQCELTVILDIHHKGTYLARVVTRHFTTESQIVSNGISQIAQTAIIQLPKLEFTKFDGNRAKCQQL